MSGALARKTLPQLTESISTIIIFCEQHQKYADLATTYSNVKSVCTDHATLHKCLEQESTLLKFNSFSNQALKSITPLAPCDIISDTGAHYSYISFIEVPARMPRTAQAKDIMLQKCESFDWTRKGLEDIKHFRRTYTAKEAID